MLVFSQKIPLEVFVNEQWTEIEREALEGVATLDEAASIAITILARMKECNGHQVVQICGPMSTGGLGSLDVNMRRFRAAIDVATERGLVVFDQIPFQEAIIRVTEYVEGASYQMDILEVFYRKIFESGHVSKALFLPDWQSSFGARWERGLIQKLGIPVEEYPEEWLSELSF